MRSRIPAHSRALVYCLWFIASCSGPAVRAEVPANDSFATAAALPSATPAEGNGDNTEATTGSSEQSAAVWWKWTAPASGTASVDTAGSSFQTWVTVYRGDSSPPATMISIGGDFYDGYRAQARMEWKAAAGETYYIAIGGYNGSKGSIRLRTDVVPTAEHDTRDQAAVLPSVSSLRVQASSVGAFYVSSGESPWFSVWWTWTAPADGITEVDVTGSGFPAAAGIYLASPPGGPPVDQAKYKDWILGYPQPVARFRAQAGAVYAIAVGWWSAGDRPTRGAIDLRLNQLPVGTAPANDSPYQPMDISAPGESFSGDTTLASSDALPFPAPANYPGRQNHSLWHRWTAPVAGYYGLMLRKARYHDSCTANLYKGATPAGLVAVSMGIGVYSRLGSASFKASAAGEVYYIEVGSSNEEDQGQFSLQVLPAPANDTFDQAVDLGSATNVDVNGTEVGSSLETGENYSGLREPGSVWYQWQAPATGVVTIAASSREPERLNPPFAAVYTGTKVTSLTWAPGSPVTPQPAFSFQATAGKVYKIAVLHAGGYIKHAKMGAGNFTLHLTMGNFGTPYQVWLLSWPELLGEAADRMGDPDGDGWTNLEELAFEGNPLIPDDTNPPLARNYDSQPPGIRLAWLKFVFLTGSGYGSPIEISPEVSSDGIVWDAPLAGEYTADSTYGRVELPFNRGPRTLVRLRVTEPLNP